MNSGIVVVDASVAVKWAVREEIDSHIAWALLAKWIRQNTLMLAPALFSYEITNILFKKVRQGNITPDGAEIALSLILDAGIEIHSPSDRSLSIRSLNLAHTFKLPATYDAHYLALAEREQCEFWTADARLYRAVREQLAWVCLMADDPAASTPA